jgi:hypothetical protein
MDMEFTGLVKNTDIISIGIVAENNDKLYCEFTDFDIDKCDSWIKDNVLSNLNFNLDILHSNFKACIINSSDATKYGLKSKLPENTRYYVGSTEYIAEGIDEWMRYELDKEHEYEALMVTDAGYYDMYLFTTIFGGSLRMPSYIISNNYDINNLICARDNIDNLEDLVSRGFGIPRETLAENATKAYGESMKHNSLFDAMVTKEIAEDYINIRELYLY